MEQNKQRIVVKVGTSTLTHNSGALDLWSMEHLVRTLADLQGMGHEVILVSSGAIAVGTAKLGLSERPKELRMKQAAAAVGQCRMMHIYDKFFSEYNRSMAQILLTGDDVEDPERAEHLSNTFSALLEMGVIPVVNENDSVSSAEIETGRHKVLGDNDTLSAIVAELCRADLLVLLSDIDGLYDADPKTHPEAKLLHQVTELTPEIVHEFIEKIVVSKSEKVEGKRRQPVDIYYKTVGLWCAPSPEEMEELFQKYLAAQKKKTA